MKRSSILNILYIDDDPQDVALLKCAFREYSDNVQLNNVIDGIDALSYLEKHSTNLPDLILMDLNMPRKNGHVLLHELKSDKKLKHIPVIVFSSSSSESDIEKSYDEGASCYILKPTGLDELKNVVKAVDSFWFSIVKYSSR